MQYTIILLVGMLLFVLILFAYSIYQDHQTAYKHKHA
jgi:predicted negative regulator of RcsB-dependent stress response